MGATQRKARQPVMVELDLLPCAHIVAGRAIRAVLAFMRIIACVTGHARPRRMLVGVSGAVTTDACRRSMCADQRKARRTMIKCRGFPIRRIMALRAIGAPAAMVGIVLRMAAVAACCEAVPALADMASHAGGGPMGPGEREARRAMVECLHRLPGHGCVAALAISPQLPAMRIFLAVAGCAIACDAAIIVGIAMA